ncbi:signal peptidase I [Aliikangiella sp. G2MR2-5]|uniref:signal peptidase I n=1 Tax=Aliikangiella sp. G2MR2-5 TaxID=2788943 RepID=UPI0018A9CA69|nr:signal peptidase I [Aliikangiella sp. G2MR2-5]
MSSNYGLILVLLTFISGLVWLIDTLTAGKERKKAIAKLKEEVKEPSKEAIEAVAKEPVHVDYAKSFFPILLFIVVLRSFLYEPFQIPSASMKPTLTEGDFILVNKFSYGLRLPVTSTKFVDIGMPERGDVAVFRPLHRPEEDYIKRIVGLPGDTVVYTRNKELFIEPACAAGTPVEECPKKIHIKKTKVSDEMYIDENPDTGDKKYNYLFTEVLGDAEHGILNNPNRRQINQFGMGYDMTFRVPENSYFVMGDNRDNSADSRYWPDNMHFVPEEQLVGQAVAVWLHLDFGIKAKGFSWIPTGIDIGRIGAIE